ncbi:MAG TPA: hypothetical protein VGR19_07385 [Allosphingosinicella sp.]|nr:hypothetical protein [Allosphingosinicella sp.]
MKRHVLFHKSDEGCPRRDLGASSRHERGKQTRRERCCYRGAGSALAAIPGPAGESNSVAPNGHVKQTGFKLAGFAKGTLRNKSGYLSNGPGAARYHDVAMDYNVVSYSQIKSVTLLV